MEKKITHMPTGRTVWVVSESHPDGGDIYVFAFDCDEAAQKWIDTAALDWLNKDENADEVREWLANNPAWTIENDAYFIFVECSGISYEKHHTTEWRLADV